MKTSIIMMILLTVIIREASMKPDFRLKQGHHVVDSNIVGKQPQPEPDTTKTTISTTTITTTESMESIGKNYIRHLLRKQPFSIELSRLQTSEIEIAGNREKPSKDDGSGSIMFIPMKSHFKNKPRPEKMQQPEPNTTTEAIITTTESMESLLNRYIEHTFGKDPFPGDWSQLQAIGIERGKKEKQPNGEVKRRPLTITIGMKQPINETRRRR